MAPKRTAQQAKADDLLVEWRTWQKWQNLSERTIAERTAFMERYFEHTPEHPLKITPQGILGYFERLDRDRKQPLKPGAKWAYAQHLRAYSLWLVRTGKRDDDPMQKLPPIRKPGSSAKPVREQDLARVLRKAEGLVRMMILLGAFAGLRVSEIARIRGEDLDRETGKLHLIGKGDKPATMKLNPIILDEAQHYPRRGLWFPAIDPKTHEPTGDPMTREAVGAAIRRAMNAAEVTASAHQLRHRFGTILLKQTSNIRTVQELMRHESLQSTQIYTKITDEQRETAVDGLTLATLEDEAR